jgi:hypothetical protein
MSRAVVLSGWSWVAPVDFFECRGIALALVMEELNVKYTMFIACLIFDLLGRSVSFFKYFF